MAARITCPNAECGATLELPEGASGRRARCRSCGTRFVLPGPGATEPGPDGSPTGVGGSADRTATDFPGQIGRFRVRDCLGSGASGVVYLAFDTVLDRDVALKLPHPGLLEGSKAAERFLREAKAAAQLHHPNIVPVFDAGRDASRYYIASAYIEGRTLSELIDIKPPPPAKAAAIASLLAEALHYAHSLAIVHRDVKPSNIIVDHEGRPHLLDFGLARLGSSDERLTLDGAILGTPAYMAPEQADGRSGDATAASDQYSLGATLYELLSGQPPFAGPADVVLYNAVHREPDPPSKLRPGVPRGLETVCLKAMAKAPGDRYENCAALADDLRRWLADEPLRAQPLSLAGRARRWTRRNRPLAALAATVAALLLTVAVGSTVGYTLLALQRRKTMDALRASRSEARRADEAARRAGETLRAMMAAQEQAEEHQRLARAQAERIRRDAERTRELKQQSERNATLAEKQAERANRTELLAEQSRRELRRQSFQENVSGAYRALTESVDVALARARLDACPPESRVWAWRYCDRLLHGSLMTLDAKAGAVRCVIYGPEGQYLATAGDDATIRLWDPATGRLIDRLVGHTGPIRSLAVDPETGDLASAGDDGRIKVWDLNSAPRKVALDLDQKNPVLALAYNASGGYLASGDAAGQVVLWNPRSGVSESVQKYFVYEEPIGRGAAAGLTETRSVPIEGKQDPKLGKPVAAHQGPVYGVVFRDARPGPRGARPESLLLVSCGVDGTARASLISLAKGTEARDATRQFRLSDLTGTHGKFEMLGMKNTEDDTIVNKTGKEVTIYHVFNVTSIASLPHAEAVYCAATFEDPRGEYLITSCRDRTIRLFDFKQRRLIGGFAGHLRDVFGLDLSPDRTWITTVSGDETVRRWRVADGAELASYRGHQGPVYAVAISPDGRWIASAGADGTVRIWDAASRPDHQTLAGHRRSVPSLAFSHGSALLASAGEDGAVILWDTDNGRQQARIDDLKVVAHDLALSHDGGTLALVGSEGQVRLASTSARRRAALTIRPPTPARAVAFAPRDLYLAVAGSGGEITLWDPKDGRLRGTPEPGGVPVHDLAISPDGRWIVAACSDRVIRVWSVESGGLDRTLGGHDDDVLQIAFDADGAHLMSGSRDGTAILWDFPNGRPIHTLKGHSGDVVSVAIGPDGRDVATAGLDRTVRVWDAESGRELLVLRGHRARIHAVAFRDDGRILATAGDDGSVLLWDAGPR
jgi:WD40 repeat protein